MMFSELLKQLKDAKGWSERELAANAGLPYQSVHSYCLGRRTPTFAAIVAIARALDVTCEAFAGCSDLVAESSPPTPTRKPGRPRKADADVPTTTPTPSPDSTNASQPSVEPSKGKKPATKRKKGKE